MTMRAHNFHIVRSAANPNIHLSFRSRRKKMFKSLQLSTVACGLVALASAAAQSDEYTAIDNHPCLRDYNGITKSMFDLADANPTLATAPTLATLTSSFIQDRRSQRSATFPRRVSTSGASTLPTPTPLARVMRKPRC